MGWTSGPGKARSSRAVADRSRPGELRPCRRTASQGGRAEPGQGERCLGGEKGRTAEPPNRHGNSATAEPTRTGLARPGQTVTRAAQMAKTGSSRPCQLSPMPNPAPPHPGPTPAPPAAPEPPDRPGLEPLSSPSHQAQPQPCSERSDQALHSFVYRAERVLAQNSPLRLVVELEVYPVHREVAACLLGGGYEIAA